MCRVPPPRKDADLAKLEWAPERIAPSKLQPSRTMMLRSLVGKQRAILVSGKQLAFSTLVRRQSPSSSSAALSWFDHRAGATYQYKKQARYYSPMTEEEEEAEKNRVAALSGFKKDQELRKLNREILKLTMLRGINTGELYSFRGRYKTLASDYALPMFLWYGFCWAGSFAALWGLTEIGGMDAMAVLAKADMYTGWNVASKVDPTYGKIGIILLLNELLEPVRFPVVVLTVKPLIDNFFPPKV